MCEKSISDTENEEDILPAYLWSKGKQMRLKLEEDLE
jgi:hypothetical protein